MAFINEKLTSQQKSEFMALGIKDPRPHSQVVLSPPYWTIDHENDMYLINVGVFKEFPNEEYFIFYTDGHFFSIVLNVSHGKNDVFWDITELTPNDSCSGNIKNLFSGFEPFTDDLKKALIAYKYNGTPKQPFENIEVHFRF